MGLGCQVGWKLDPQGGRRLPNRLHLVDAEGLCRLALELHTGHQVDRDVVLARVVGRLPDEEMKSRCMGAEARGGVDCVAKRGVLDAAA